jgi:hypothetical protein
MSPLFGPILAQIVTLGVSDGTEARYIARQSDTHFEASTTPRVGLNVDWRHSSLTLAYGPSITVLPLESTPRETLILHNGLAGIGYRWRRTTVAVSETLSYGEVNFQTLALADPRAVSAAPAPSAAPGGMTPTPTGATGGTATPGATPGGMTPGGSTTGNGATVARQVPGVTIPFVLSTTSLDVTHKLSPVLTLSEGVAYLYQGGIGDEAEKTYPLSKGVRGIFNATYRLTHRDSVTSAVTSAYTHVLGDSLWVTNAQENWSHALDPRTGTLLGGGVSIARTSRDDGFVSYAIYPTFTAGISHTESVARGVLRLSLGATAAPAIDPLHSTIDPRLGMVVGTAWSRDRFSASATGTSAISLSQDTANAFNSVNAALVFAYYLGAGFTVNSGVRASWQSFAGESTIPPAYAIFLGASWGTTVPLARGR